MTATPGLGEPERAALIEELATARTGAGLGDDPGAEAHRRSPACGDDVTVRVVLDGERIAALRWEGHGCVVSTAAASALARTAPGLGTVAFRALAELPPPRGLRLPRLAGDPRRPHPLTPETVAHERATQVEVARMLRSIGGGVPAPSA